MISMFWFWPPLGVRFGGVLGALMEAKAIKKPLQKKVKKLCPKWPQTDPKGVPKWSPFVSTLFQGWLTRGLQSPSRIDFGEVLGPCWDHVCQFFWHIFVDLRMHSFAACCEQKPTNEEGITKRRYQRTSKKDLLSPCHLALNSSLANVNELSGPC